MVPSACLLLVALFGVCAGHQFYIHNRCSHDVWVGLLGRPYTPDNGGYKLSPGQSRTTNIPNHWSGRVWGRTGCSASGHCQTGDCGNRIECNGAGGVPPATLAEITFDAGGGTQDFYDVSLVDGYNLKMSMEPASGFHKSGGGAYDCTWAGCNKDLNSFCPNELRVYGQGGTVGCKSACLAFGRSDYCCSGSHNTPDKCPPFAYSRTFKDACPKAYSYAYDDQTSTFTCQGNAPGTSNYNINFC